MWTQAQMGSAFLLGTLELFGAFHPGATLFHGRSRFPVQRALVSFTSLGSLSSCFSRILSLYSIQRPYEQSITSPVFIKIFGTTAINVILLEILIPSRQPILLSLPLLSAMRWIWALTDYKTLNLSFMGLIPLPLLIVPPLCAFLDGSGFIPLLRGLGAALMTLSFFNVKRGDGRLAIDYFCQETKKMGQWVHRMVTDPTYRQGFAMTIAGHLGMHLITSTTLLSSPSTQPNSLGLSIF